MFGIAEGAQVKLLGPAFFRVEDAKEFHHEGGKALRVVRPRRATLQGGGKNGGGLFFRAVQGGHQVEAMIGQAAARGMEKAVALAQGFEKSFESVRAHPRRLAEAPGPGLEAFGLGDAQGVVGAEGGKDLDLPAGPGEGLVVFEGVGGIICRAYYFDVHALDQPARGPARLGEQAVGLGPDGGGGGFVEQGLDVEIAAQFEVGPMEERVAQSVGHGGGPGLELLAGRAFLAGDEPLRHAVGPHGAPFVMVAFQPGFVQVFEAAVFRQVARGKMTMIINDRLGRGRAVEKLAGDRVGEQKVLVAEFHNGKGSY